MTTIGLSHYIGFVASWRTGSLSFSVRILDCKRAYGRTRYLIQPIAGTGQQWIQDGLILPTEGN